MSNQVSMGDSVDQKSRSSEDADLFEAVIAGFMAACAQTLFQTRTHIETKTPRLSALTIGLTMVVAVLSSSAAIVLFTSGATLLQVVLSSIGELFLFVMVAMSGLMDLQGNHKRNVKREIAGELAKCQEMATAMSNLMKLRSQWNKSIFDFEYNLASIKTQIEQTEFELNEKGHKLKDVCSSLEVAQTEQNEVLAGLDKCKAEAALLAQQRDSINADVTGLKEQLSTTTNQLAETVALVEAERNRLSELEKQHTDLIADFSTLDGKHRELATVMDDLTLQKLQLDENVESLAVRSQELTAIEGLLAQRNEEQRAASASCETLLQLKQTASSELEAVSSQLELSKSELAELDGNLRRVRTEITVAQQERYGIANAIAAKQAEADEWAEQMITRRQQLEQSLTELTAKIATATDELSYLENSRAELLEIQNQQKQATTVLENQRVAITEGAAELARCQDSQTQVSDRIAAMNTESASLEAMIAQLQATMLASANDAEVAQQEIEVLRTLLAKLEVERDESIDSINHLSTSKQELELQIDQRNSDLQQLADQIEDRKKSCELVDAEYLKLLERQNTLKHEIDSLERESQSLRDQHADTEDLRMELTHQCDELRTLQHQIQEQVAQTKSEHSRLVEQCEMVSAEINGMRSDNARLQLKAVALRAQESSLRDEIQELTETRERLSQEATEAQNVVVDLNGQAERLQESLRARDAVRLQILKLTEEKEQLSVAVKDSNENLISLSQRITASNRISEELSAQIAEADLAIQSRNEILANHQQEICEKQSLCDRLTTQVCERQAAIDAAEMEYQRLVEKADELAGLSHQVAIEGERLENYRQASDRIAKEQEKTESQLVIVRKEFEDAEKKMNDISEQIRIGQRRLEQEEFDIEKMMKDKDRLNHELQDFQRSLNETAKRRDELRVESENYLQRSESLRLTIGKLELEVDRLDAVKREGELLRMRNIDLEREIMINQQTASEIDKNIQSMQRQSTTLADAIAKLDESRLAKEDELRQLSEQSEQQAQSLAGARSRQNVAEQEFGVIENSISNRRSELLTLEQSIQASLLEKQLLESDLDQMKASVANWTSQSDDAARSLAELDSLRAEHSHLILSIDQEQSVLQATRLQLKEVVDARDSVQRHLEMIESEIEGSTAKIDDIKQSASTLNEQLRSLANSKQSLEDELARYEAALQAKQQEILNIESRDRLRQSLASQELDESSVRLAETERRLADAKEALRAQEVNVNEAIAVSQQWDAYIVSLRSKLDGLQDENSKSTLELQVTLAEKLRAEGELSDAMRRCSDAESQTQNAKVRLAEIESEISEKTKRHAAMQAEMEARMLRLQANSEQSQRQLSDQQRQIETHNETIRSMIDEIAGKKQTLAELSVMIETPKVNPAISAGPQEDLLQQIETLVERIDQAADPSIAANTLTSETPAKPSIISKRNNESKQTPPDPWASVLND